MSEFLKVSVPESHHTLDFISGACQTLAVVACVAWDRSAKPLIRDEFRDDIRSRIDALMSSDRLGLHSRATDFVIGENYRYRSADPFPKGFNGLSLALVDDSRTAGTAVPHALVLNYVGKTGIYVPGKLHDVSGTYGGYVSDRNGLFSIPPAIEHYEPADTHTLVFSSDPLEIYVGLSENLESMRRGGAFTSRSDSHGSIITAKQILVARNVEDYPKGMLSIDPLNN